MDGENLFLNFVEGDSHESPAKIANARRRFAGIKVVSNQQSPGIEWISCALVTPRAQR